ncbi:MAG: hypothetical protein AABY28_04700 [Candidatus Omnitrophota bacterium]
MPRVATYSHLKSITKKEIKPKGMFGGNKSVSIYDFRGIERYDEDIDALKVRVEKYISSHPDLSGAAKNNLRELKASEGAAKEEVELLLGKPDKVIKPSGKTQDTSEIWIYSKSKLNAFTVFIFPVFPTHERYYLYFQGNTLANIEKHYLEQLLESTSPADPSDKKL